MFKKESPAIILASSLILEETYLTSLASFEAAKQRVVMEVTDNGVITSISGYEGLPLLLGTF